MFPNAKLHANDLDENIFSFWQMTQENEKTKRDFIKKLKITPTVEMFNTLRAKKPNTLLEKAFHAVFFNRCTFSGISTAGPIGGQQQKSKWGVGCRYNSKILIKKFIALSDLLNGRLKVSNLPFQDYLLNIEGCLYLDPPYYKQGKELYPVHMNHAEHEQLRDILKEKKNWVLSYDDCKEIRELYQDFKIDEVGARYSINGVKKSWSSKKELIVEAQ